MVSRHGATLRPLEPARLGSVGGGGGEIGLPPGVQSDDHTDPGERGEPSHPARLVAGLAGFAILALVSATQIFTRRSEAPSSAMVFAHAFALLLSAFGYTGLRTAPASFAAAANVLAAFAWTTLPLYDVLDVQSLTVRHAGAVLFHGVLTFAFVMNAAACVGSARKLGPLRLIVAALWFLASIASARFLYAALKAALRDPLNPADDLVWEPLYFGFVGLAAATAAVAFLVAKLRASEEGLTLDDHRT